MQIFGGAYIGRFQPFHKGHYNALKWILRREGSVVLCIGSAQHSHKPENPFTYAERYEMIWLQLREDGLLEKVAIVGVPDSEMHSTWVSLLLHYCPKFRMAYSNEPLTVRLLKEAGVPVHPIPFFDRKVYEATRIRKLMASGEDWHSLVPPKVYEYIVKNQLDRRVMELFTDKKKLESEISSSEALP